ncbi:VWA domain-containing protein [Meiothermus sp. CFH 77666]|uniref:vWA domain-containing protein n=1 Tax=Meiothermus sp. CFH 77666 TaxID=2817942 RepID=UPI001AA085B0|nr:VWA domain-containing protein [Meiothermus sp. CFH 77666]MBO1435834.1 VWA domain-containing protein [Meiothermus sp. CFH 77666]
MSTSAEPLQFPYGSLPENLIAFTEHLRHTTQRFNLGPGEVQDALEALGAINLGSLQEVRQALKLVLCSNLEQERVFDDLFFQFFLPSRKRVGAQPNSHKASPGSQGETGQKSQPARNTPSENLLDPKSPLAQGKAKLAEDSDKSDWAAPLLKAMFSRTAGSETPEVEIPQQDLDEMLQAATQLINQVRLGRSRRWVSTPKGTRFHFRRTLRKALHTGGDPLYPAWQRHPKRQPRFVFVLDGSRSMQSYSDRLLQFAFALRMRCNRVEVFVFSTSLKRITRQLEKAGNLSERPRLSRLGQAWGGGTQIGENLLYLEQKYGGLIRGDSIVIVASDGLDTGAPEVLDYALRQIYHRSAALIWLNPLLKYDGYNPHANCMKAALPYLDRFCAAHTPKEYAQLTHRLRLRK